MVGLRDSLEEELNHLQKLKTQLENQNRIVPGELSLRISSCKGKPRYFVRDKNGNYTYVKKSEQSIAKEIAQFEYENKINALIDKRIVQLQRFLKAYSDHEIDDVYELEKTFRKSLIDPVQETWEQKFARWEQLSYRGKGFREEDPIIKTAKGERVRSKSEKILADFFYHKKIPYKYEKPIRLPAYGGVYPDFTFLSRIKQKEVYLEHLGMMDDPIYATKAIKKIDDYINSGILPGDRLFLTYETSEYPVQMDSLEKIVEQFW